MSAEKPIIEVNNLGKRYHLGQIGAATLRESIEIGWQRLFSGKKNQTQDEPHSFWALHDVSFTVQRGEVVGIIGRNGAGKSTLLKILSRITEPTCGRAILRGRVASLLEVGTGFHPELTAIENVYLNGAILGMRRAEVSAKLDEILAFAGVEKFADTPVKRFSSGMYVRLAFAVAAHLEPEILIVDEVLAVGDAEFQRKALGKMKDVSSSEGRTVLFVSHNMGAIRTLCERVILFKEGKIEMDDSPDKAIGAYLEFDMALSSHGEKKFTADSLKEFQVLAICTHNESHKITDHFSCDEDFYVSFKCESRRAIPRLYGYLTFNRTDGSIVWESDSLDFGADNNPFNNLNPGTYEASVRIPKRTLAPGDYKVYLSFASPSHHKFDMECVEFPLIFSLSDETTYRGNRRNGYFSTLLEWKLGRNSYPAQ
jgi:lipopolysaccharide transport system ATP-binding protein